MRAVTLFVRNETGSAISNEGEKLRLHTNTSNEAHAEISEVSLRIEPG